MLGTVENTDEKNKDGSKQPPLFFNRVMEISKSYI